METSLRQIDIAEIERILQNPHFKLVFDAVRQDIFEQWDGSPFGGSIQREALWHRLKALDEVLIHMESLVTEARLLAEGQVDEAAE